MCAVCQSESASLVRGLCPSCAGSTVIVEAEPREEDPFWAKGSPKGKIKARGPLFKEARDLLKTCNVPDTLRDKARRMPTSQEGRNLRRQLMKRAALIEDCTARNLPIPTYVDRRRRSE